MEASYPRRQLFGIGAAVAATAAATTFTNRSSIAATSVRNQAVQWDPNARQEVMMLLHQMHEAWNRGDVAFIERSITNDGFIGTFELTGDERPVVLDSRESLLGFIHRLVSDMSASGTHTEAAPQRKHQVLATSTFAICTEECDLIERHADGSRFVLPHRGTSALAKTPDGWKFVHWHVSQGGPGKQYDPAGKEVV